jgi:hypothetical protein
MIKRDVLLKDHDDVLDDGRSGHDNRALPPATTGCEQR